jgi:cyclophilin family peptidyl-prolyl cis-trans isomerase/HEAT repeat protein
MKRLWYLSVILLPIGWLLGCQAPTNRFSDPHLLRIALLQDSRKSDSLLLYLNHPDSIYRAAAALAFGSVQDSMMAYHLGDKLLEDESISVRINTAFALGQTGSFQAVNSLLPALKDPESKVIREVLEALGKTITAADLPQLSRFQPKDSLQQEGLAWALYRLALRNLADSIHIVRASEFLDARYSFQTRLAAAHFFARSPSFTPKHYVVQTSIVYSIDHEESAEIRMAVVQGLKHVSAEKALPLIRDILIRQEDERVKISAIRACLAFEFSQTLDALRMALKDTHHGVRIAASEVIRSQTQKNEQITLSHEVTEATDWRVKSNLMAAMVQAHQEYTFAALLQEYDQADIYARSHLLSAIGELKNDREAFDFLSHTLTSKSEPPVIRTAAAEALVKMQKLSDQINPEEFLQVCRAAMAQGDVAVIGILASALSDPARGFQKTISNVSFLEEAKKTFKLPRDIESLQPVIEALAFLKGEEKPRRLMNSFNHPIDQKLVRSIPVHQWVVVETTKGKIILQLLVEEAPGSVANFVALLRQQYFDGKAFHRVVPNFVVQTGCSRGDGYGSEDYSLRSEFSLTRYREGAVGMASAGKDTEGTQWFISHSPTPHLDGRYTIFAQVVEGMEVVRTIGVGDKILSVRENP